MNLSYVVNATKKAVMRAELFSGAANSNPITPVEVDATGYDIATILIGNNSPLPAATKLKLEGRVDAGGTYQGWVPVSMEYNGAQIEEFAFTGVSYFRGALKADVSRFSKIRAVVESSRDSLLSVYCELYTGAYTTPRPVDFRYGVSQDKNIVKGELVHRGAINGLLETPVVIDSEGYNTCVIELGYNSGSSRGGELIVEGSVLSTDVDYNGWERVPMLMGGVLSNSYLFKGFTYQREAIKLDVSRFSSIRIRSTYDSDIVIALKVKLSVELSQIDFSGTPRLIFSKTDEYFTTRKHIYSGIESSTGIEFINPIDVSNYPHISIIIENNLNVDMTFYSVRRYMELARDAKQIDEVQIGKEIKSGESGVFSSVEWDFLKEMLAGYILDFRKSTAEATGSINIKIIGRK